MEGVLPWTNRNIEHNLDPSRHTYRLEELHWYRVCVCVCTYTSLP
jgi:hypothetical protein